MGSNLFSDTRYPRALVIGLIQEHLKVVDIASFARIGIHGIWIDEAVTEIQIVYEIDGTCYGIETELLEFDGVEGLSSFIYFFLFDGLAEPQDRSGFTLHDGARWHPTVQDRKPVLLGPQCRVDLGGVIWLGGHE